VFAGTRQVQKPCLGGRGDSEQARALTHRQAPAHHADEVGLIDFDARASEALSFGFGASKARPRAISAPENLL